MSTESGAMMGDTKPVAQLIDCVPAEAPVVSVPLPRVPDDSPVTAAMDATIENTGADPPPDGDQ